jgi:hypothetical protein
VSPRAGLDDMEKWKFFPPPGLESLGRTARSQSLYRLRYQLVGAAIIDIQNACSLTSKHIPHILHQRQAN